ncbi:hypothetical protein V8D89_015605 [Ganoderma adspersum]
MLGGVADHNLEREHSSRKRNRSGRPTQTEGSKRAKTDQGSVLRNPSETIGSLDGGTLDADVLATTPIPPVLLSLTVGINEVTKRLERLAASHRSHVETRSDQGDLLSNATPTTPSPSRLVIACRADVDPPILLGHIPNLVATCNSARRVYGTDSPQPGGTWLVPMPKGAEETLSRAMGLRRVSILLVEVCLSHSSTPWPSSRSHRAPRRNIPPWCHFSRRSPCRAPLGMFIAIIGTRFAGKSTVQRYLVNVKGFTPVQVSRDASDKGHGRESFDEQTIHGRSQSDYGSTSPLEGDVTLSISSLGGNPRRVSFLSMVSPVSPDVSSPAQNEKQHRPMVFRSTAALLSHVTKNWRTNFVTLDLHMLDELTEFMTRPFVLVVSVDSPLLERYRRSLEWSDYSHSLEDFIREHDTFYYGPDDRESGQNTPKLLKPVAGGQPPAASFRSLSQLATVHVVNAFQTIPALHDHLDEINLLDPDRLRPGWDTYFMQLASLASHRSNCMKRRVGAILVRNKRIVSTGYNGTPRGVKNCNEGGCTRCNTASETSDECLCLHAEENALLEAGRERVGDGSVLYCNTCPCLKCTIKIIQTGVKEVVYNLSYKVDDASAALFAEAGVILRRHASA